LPWPGDHGGPHGYAHGFDIPHAIVEEAP
jgi:hypothetical protein